MKQKSVIVLEDVEDFLTALVFCETVDIICITQSICKKTK
jgi:hypothetical protein